MGRSKPLDPRASLAAALGSRVRKLRDGRGWTQQDLADRLYVSASRVAQIELATDPPNESLSQDLDRVLESDEEISIAWHHMNRARHPEWVRPYIDLEARASRMRYYASQLVPGLLQTPAYARALLLSGQPGVSEDDLSRQVEARTSRGVLLEGSDPIHLWMILDESILLRPFGTNPEVMRVQLEHLLTISERPHIDLQVMPLKAGHHAALGGSLILLDFPDGPDIAYLAGLGTGEVVESARTVKRYATIYDRLMIRALSPEASQALVRSTLKEHYGCPPSSP
jgi:transcriptional regulator with XRE-family HTH domain